MAALGIVSKRNTPTPSGKRDSRYPDGNDGTAAIPLAWATIPSFSGKLEGTPFSVNVRTGYLTEPGGPDATITVEGSLPSGWSFLTSTLSYSGTGTGQATIRFKAERGGFEAFSNFFIVEGIAVAASDTTAPTVPTGLTATPGSGNVTLEWDASSDPHDGSEPGSGVDEYDVLLNDVVVHTLAGSAGLSRELAEHIIGASDGTPDSTQTGADWELSFGGAGIDDTTDQILTRSAVMAGNGFAVVKITGATTAAPFAKFGIMARETLDVGAKYLALHYQTGGRLKFRNRSNTDGATVDQVNQLISLPVWVKLEREYEENRWTASYSTDGAAWTVIGTLTLSMQSAVEWGLFVTSNSAGANCVADFEQWNLNNVARVSYQHTTATGGTYKIVARDVEGNESADSTGVSGVPEAATLIRAYSGHYWRGGVGDSQSTWLNTTIPAIDDLSYIKGIAIYRYWKNIETSKGTFGWAFEDAVIGAAQAANKKVIWRVQDRAFNTIDATAACPQYLVDEELTYVRNTASKLTAGAALWRHDAMTYNIALYKRFIDRYRAAVNQDGTPTIAMLLGEESTYGPTDTVAGQQPYTAAACVAQEIRRMQELRAYAPAIPWCWLTNWINGESTGKPRMVEFCTAARTEKGYYFNGGPDTLVGDTPEEETDSDGHDVMYGLYGGVDHRGAYLVLNSTEQADFQKRGATPADVYAKAVTQNGANICLWYRLGGGTVTPSAILSYLSTHPVNTAVPSQLTGLVTTF